MAEITQEQVEALIRDEASLPAEWELWTSNSYRRIMGDFRSSREVLGGVVQRDGHPDLSMPAEQLAALVRLRNALPALLRLARLATPELVALGEAAVDLARERNTSPRSSSILPFTDRLHEAARLYAQSIKGEDHGK